MKDLSSSRTLLIFTFCPLKWTVFYLKFTFPDGAIKIQQTSVQNAFFLQAMGIMNSKYSEPCDTSTWHKKSLKHVKFNYLLFSFHWKIHNLSAKLFLNSFCSGCELFSHFWSFNVNISAKTTLIRITEHLYQHQ